MSTQMVTPTQILTTVGMVVVVFMLMKIFRRIISFIYSMKVFNRLPSPEREHFFLGHAPILEKDPREFYKQLKHYSNKFHKEGIFRVRIGLLKAVACYTPEFAETLLSSTKHLNKATLYRVLHSWIGLGLLTADAQRWRPRRKLLTHAFHFRILQDFLPVLNDHAQTLLTVIEEERLQESNRGKGVSIYPLITRCALDIISDTAMGVRLNAQRDPSCSYVRSILYLSEAAINRMKNPLHVYDLLFSMLPEGREYNRHIKTVHEFTDDVIRKRKAVFLEQQTGGKTTCEPGSTSSRTARLAFLDLLLTYQHEQMSSKNPLSDMDIREEVDTFMFEGHDTTAAGMTWALYLLATHPHVQEKLHEELDNVLEMNEPSTGDRSPITTEQLGHLHYLDLVIKEALRLYPPVPMIGRVCDEDINVNGYRVEKGVELIFLITALHRREELFPRATEFIPERFERGASNSNLVDIDTSESPTTKSAFMYTPFSAGPRNCIGSKFAQQEEKVILATVLSRYSISCQQSEADVAPRMDIILRPGNDIFLQFTPRHRE